MSSSMLPLGPTPPRSPYSPANSPIDDEEVDPEADTDPVRPSLLPYMQDQDEHEKNLDDEEVPFMPILDKAAIITRPARDTPTSFYVVNWVAGHEGR